MTRDTPMSATGVAAPANLRTLWRLAGMKNFVSAALTEGLAGKVIATASTRPYGCVVKYDE